MANYNINPHVFGMQEETKKTFVGMQRVCTCPTLILLTLVNISQVWPAEYHTSRSLLS